LSNSQTPPTQVVRRRMQVNTPTTVITPGQVAAHRHAHAAEVMAEMDITRADTEASAISTFNPRDINRITPPNRQMPPPIPNPIPAPTTQPAPPDAQEKTMEDVMAAFAKAGQKATIISGPNRPVNPPINPEEDLGTTIAAPEELTDEIGLRNVRVEGAIEDTAENSFRVDLPSNGVFYNFNSIMVRPFDVPELAKLYRARQQRSQTLLIDCVALVCEGIDVRDLTPRDFRYILYQLRINSFLRSPYRLTFTSFYGNRNEFTITESNLDVKLLQASPEEYAEWQARGLSMFTVRDQEEYDNSRQRLGEDAEFYWSRAKYCPGANVAEKIKSFHKICKEHGIDFMFHEIEQFNRKFEDYGVTETVELTDQHFNAQVALERLNAEILATGSLLRDTTLAVSVADAALERINLLQTEVNRINQEILTSGEATPRRETIEFSIEVADFFPSI
jgi:hypothetical protein